MRTRIVLIGALLLVPAGLTQAQAQQQHTNGGSGQFTATPASSFQPAFGRVDFGFRADDLSGDQARYNKYRDLRQGGYLDRFSFQKETASTFFRAEANNVGYRDQRFFAQYLDIGRLNATFEWNQVPLFLSAGSMNLNEGSRSLYRDAGGGVLTIDQGIRQQIQAAGNAAAVRDPLIASAMNQAQPFDLRSRRDLGAFNLTYAVNRDVDLKLNVRNTLRSGHQVLSFGLGTSPGLNPSVEIPAPMDDRTTDVRGALEFANATTFMALGYTGSWYENSIPLVRFDNPLRATDISGGASAGQAVMWPSNTSFAVTANASHKLAARTRASGYVSIGRWSQNEALAPATVNTALVAPPMMRSSAQTRADIVSMAYNLNSRPVRNVWLNAKYRYYDYNNKSAHWESRVLVGDWALGTAIHENEPASFKRQNLDLDASLTLGGHFAFGLGYGREDADRTWRIFEKTSDDTFRVSMDNVGNQYMSLRTKYEFSQRRGSGFDVHLLEHANEQPGMRHYDIADRDRSRLSGSIVLTPTGFLSLNLGAAYGRDNYMNSGFGLRDNKNRTWTTGFDIVPIDTVNFGMAFGHEKLSAYQYSRWNSQAPGNAQFFDPRRDWWIDSDDVVKTVTASLDLIKALPKTDVSFSYDLSDGRALYVYRLPADTTIAAPGQLAPLKNTLSGGRADVRYFVRPNVALGVAYHYEDYKVDDFALGTGTINRLDARNGTTGVFASTLYTGYLFRPYTAHTAWMRLTYLW
jgi:MtrB/PioB family decaheme-associated outer membrane protein